MNTTRYYLSEKELRYIGKRMPKGYSLTSGQIEDGSTLREKDGLNEKKRVSRHTSSLEERWSNTAAGIIGAIMNTECMKLLSEEFKRQQSVDGTKSGKCAMHGLDLASVKRKLMIGDYIGQTAFLRDMDTIWLTGSKFPPDSKVSKLCQALHDIFDQTFFHGKEASEIPHLSSQSLRNLLKQEQKAAKGRGRNSHGDTPKRAKRVRKARPRPATAAPGMLLEGAGQFDGHSESGSSLERAKPKPEAGKRKRSESRRNEVSIIPVKPATGKQKFEASNDFQNLRQASHASQYAAEQAAPSKESPPAIEEDIRALLQQELSEFVKDASDEEIGNLIDIYRRHIDEEIVEREVEIKVLEMTDSAVNDMREYIARRKRLFGGRNDLLNVNEAHESFLEPKDYNRDARRTSRDLGDSSRSSFFTGNRCLTRLRK